MEIQNETGECRWRGTERRAFRLPTELFNETRRRANETVAEGRKRGAAKSRLPALSDSWRRPLENLGMTAGLSPFVRSFSRLLALLTF